MSPTRAILSLAPLLVAASTFSSCRRSEPPHTLTVAVSIPPLVGIIAPLLDGIDHDIVSLIPPGVSEHGYEVPPAKMQRLAHADAVFYVGLGLDPFVEKWTRSKRAGAAARLRFADAADVTHHDHDHGHNHDHALDTDPHLWLDPDLVARFVPRARETLERALASRGRLDAPTRDRLAASQSRLLAQIADIDAAYRAEFSPGDAPTFVVAHDAYRRLADRYGFHTIPIAGLLATEPSPADIERAIREIRQRNVRAVFVEPQLSRAAADRVAAATGARVLTLDPVGGEDWFATMRANLEQLKRARRDSGN